MAAQSGHNVTLVEVSADLLKKAEGAIVTNLSRVAKKVYKDNPAEGEKFVAAARSNLKTSTDANAAVADADLVVEAIVENMDVKHKLFKGLDAAAPLKTIFASNTR